MNTTVTVICSKCDYNTDWSILSETNPIHCPDCGGTIIHAGTLEPYYDASGERIPDREEEDDSEEEEYELARLKRL